MIQELIGGVLSVSGYILAAASAVESDPVAALIGGGGLAGLQVWNIIQTSAVKDRISKMETRLAVLESKVGTPKKEDSDD